MLTLLLVAVMVISAVEKQETDRVADVRIAIDPLPNGKLLIDSMDVRKTIELAFGFQPDNKEVGAIDIERVERVLEDEPFVRDAEVHLDASDVIRIKLTQRRPVLRVIDAEGINYYLDEEGIRLPLSVHHTARVTVASGDIPPHVPDFLVRKKHMLKELFYLNQFIRTDPFWQSMIEQIYVEGNEFVLVPKIGKQKIRLGGYADFAEKFNRLRIFYNEVMTREGFRKYTEIDARFDGQVIGRK